MRQIPHDPALDSTLAILREGYDFIWNRCKRFDSEIFATRLLGQRAVCIHGSEAAALFYDTSKFQRRHALPRRVVTSLFGKRAVQTLDDDEHRQRKAMFLSLMTPAKLEKLMLAVAEQWRSAIRRWEKRDTVVLFDEVQRILTAAVCEWAGIVVRDKDLEKRARDLGRMVDAFGGAGPRLWKGKLARMRSQVWIARAIRQTRSGELRPAAGSPLSVIAQHRDKDGKLLGARVAAVELLNIIRPTAAIAWYITFAALALHEQPEASAKLRAEPFGEGAGEYADLFAQEVRRFFPFTPYLGAMVRAPFQWRGYDFVPGTLVLLDVFGMNHDPKIWANPELFRPERFRNWDGDSFSFIPQGGGSLHHGHRCAGEWITMHNLALALHFLTRCMTYEVVADQRLAIDRTRMPTRPESGFVIRNVRATAALDAATPMLPSRRAARDSAVAGAPRSINLSVSAS
jgi:fatty-acid peroxygenase